MAIRMEEHERKEPFGLLNVLGTFLLIGLVFGLVCFFVEVPFKKYVAETVVPAIEREWFNFEMSLFH